LEAILTSERRARKKDRTKQALLDAALAIFSERGIYAPSIEEITEGADLGKGTFYQYFSSREDLIAELVRRGIDGLLVHLDQEISSAGDRSEALKILFSAHGRYFHDHPEYLLLLHQARGRMKLPMGAQGPIREEFLRYAERLERYIPPKIGGVAVRPPRRRRMALVLGGFVSGVLSFQYLFGGGLEALLGLSDDAALMAALMMP
jgi:AcrR family transcriptional regulator